MKAKVPYAKALARAEFWANVLTPFCEIVKIAGSLRRRKPAVGDIEIVLVPKMELTPANIFEAVFGGAPKPVDLADANLTNMLKQGLLTKRVGESDHTSWGPQNKLAVDVATGIPIDFFSTTKENFPMLLAIRTGGKQTNINLANAAARRGWKLKPYEGGYQHRKSGEMHICPTEDDVFRFVGIQPAPPTHRV